MAAIVVQMRHAVVITQAGAHDAAQAPDLPGVITTRATPDETAQHLRRAIPLQVRELRDAGVGDPPPSARTTYVRVA